MIHHTSSADRITVQCAVEAIANNPDDYHLSTVLVVQRDAIAAGVSWLYVDMLPATGALQIGARVRRNLDGLVGRVVAEQHPDEGPGTYAVDLGRTPLDGLDSDVWSGTAEAWEVLS